MPRGVTVPKASASVPQDIPPIKAEQYEFPVIFRQILKDEIDERRRAQRRIDDVRERNSVARNKQMHVRIVKFSTPVTAAKRRNLHVISCYPCHFAGVKIIPFRAGCEPALLKPGELMLKQRLMLARIMFDAGSRFV